MKEASATVVSPMRRVYTDEAERSAKMNNRVK